MELRLEKQPKKYLSSLDEPTRAKLERALRGICDLKGDIVKLSGTKDLFRYKNTTASFSDTAAGRSSLLRPSTHEPTSNTGGTDNGP